MTAPPRPRAALVALAAACSLFAAGAPGVLAQAPRPGTGASPLPVGDVRPVDTAGLASGLLWAETITPDELREHAFVLASDSLQGRETGELGQRRAARYLGAQMAAMGLPRIGADYTYEQPIAFESSRWDTTGIRVDGREFRWLRTVYALPNEVSGLEGTFDDALFLGYGIDADGYSDYRAAGDLEGRVGVVLSGEPFGKTGVSRVTGTADTSAWSDEGAALKIAAAERAGLAALLIVSPTLKADALANMPRIVERGLRAVPPGRRAGGGEPEARSNTVYVDPAVLEALAGRARKRVVRARKRIARGGESRPVELAGLLEITLRPERSRLEGSNVLGYVRGSDESVADQLVVVSAHYDHLGTRGGAVFNGADDNASGTSTVLEMAEAMAAAQRAGEGPRRSVLFLLVSGEEKGLLGSQYYAEHPVFPLEQTVADVNIDMIGRYDEAHADSSAYIYVIGAGRISPDLDAVTRAMNEAYSRYELDYTFDAPDDPNRFYYRSDHYNFARVGIPSVFFFSGVHEDYHRPTDTPDKLDYDKMATVGRHAFLIAWNLANREGALNRVAGE